MPIPYPLHSSWVSNRKITSVAAAPTASLAWRAFRERVRVQDAFAGIRQTRCDTENTGPNRHGNQGGQAWTAAIMANRFLSRHSGF